MQSIQRTEVPLAVTLAEVHMTLRPQILPLLQSTIVIHVLLHTCSLASKLVAMRGNRMSWALGQAALRCINGMPWRLDVLRSPQRGR